MVRVELPSSALADPAHVTVRNLASVPEVGSRVSAVRALLGLGDDRGEARALLAEFRDGSCQLALASLGEA
jgi:hypothetical protein